MNSELETNDGPKRQKEDMTLNAKLKRRWRTISQTPLTQNAPLEESIVISNEWSNGESQENSLPG